MSEIHCTSCGQKFEAKKSMVGKYAGVAGGAALGGQIGAGVGVPLGPLGIIAIPTFSLAGAIIGAAIGATVGLSAGKELDKVKCPACGNRF
ncbi:MAG: hypothetical protein ACLP5H_32995 [Desulfomonilaceae bacterium]